MADNALKTTKPAKQERRPNALRTAETRKALIEATIACLCDLGYSRTTTLEISRRAEITPGALQHHFGKKDELVLAALDTLMVEMSIVLDRAEHVHGTIQQKIGAFVDLLWDEFYADARYIAVWEIVIGSRGEPDLHPRVAAHRQASVEKCEDVWCRAFDLPVNRDDPRVKALHFALNYLRGSAMLPIVPTSTSGGDGMKEALKDFLGHEFIKHDV